MEIDLEQLSASQTFDSTVCVIGAGVAGLMLANRLAKDGVTVHLLEGGGLLPEVRSQALYETRMGAEKHLGANVGRFRTFGGSSTEWGGQLLPFTADIFTPPDGAPSQAWPLNETEILPYYLEAAQLLGLNELPFTSELLPALGHAAAPQSPEMVLRFSKWLPFSERNLANTLGARALSHCGIIVFTHANATRLERAEGASGIGALRVVNYKSLEFRFTARQFVVCTGTLESSRLLLCSPDVPHDADQMGRYFHDHLSFHAAKFDSPGRERAVQWLGPYFVEGTLHSAKLEASPSLRSRERLLAVMAHMVVMEPEDSGTAAVRNLLRSLQHGKLKDAVFANLLPTLRGIGDVTRLLLYARFKHRRAVIRKATLFLNIDVEQEAHAENRIRLSETETDALGMPLMVVDWRVRAVELDTVVRFVPFLRGYLESLGIQLADWDQAVVNGTRPAMVDTYHMMGGLRMGVDPAHSVVDRELKVHGLENLYVASCAVFPSGSSSNPTFTLMALTLRLAARLTKLVTSHQVSAARIQ